MVLNNANSLQFPWFIVHFLDSDSTKIHLVWFHLVLIFSTFFCTKWGRPVDGGQLLGIMRCIVCNLELCSRRWVYIAQIFFVFCSLIRKDWTHFILLLPKCNLPYMHCLYGKNPCNSQCKFIVKWFHTIVGSKGDQILKEILTFLPYLQKEQNFSHLLFV